MKKFCFTVDDNIRCLKELTENRRDSIFEHPYLNMYKRLHERFAIKVQLNLFYEVDGFDLSEMTDKYKEEWRENSDWLKLSFHSRLENKKPYLSSGYDEVFGDCQSVHREIIRFASPAALARTTTVHCCNATHEGLCALKDNGVEGLLGLYGKDDAPRASYQNSESEGALLRNGATLVVDGIAHAGIDVILNCHSIENILIKLKAIEGRELVKIMIHEQYFYPDYHNYQENFEQKLCAAFEFLTERGFESTFFEENLPKSL